MDSTAWIDSNVGADLVAPKTSGPGARSPADYRAVVDQFEVGTIERYRKRDIDGKPGDETFCNTYVHDVLQAMGAPIPRMRANDHQAYLESALAKQHGWYKCPEWAARYLANRGCPVIALWTNPDGPHGHVAAVVPARTELDVNDITFIAQAGVSNFSYGRLAEGFGKRPVVFFSHP